MTARTPTYLKARYEQGDIPQGTDYEDVFDSYINVVVSAEQTIDSNLKTTKELIAANVSATNINITGVATLNSVATLSMNVTTLNATNVSAVTVSASSIFSNSASIQIVSASDINVSGKVVFGAFDISALSTTQSSAVLVNGTTNFVIFANGNDTALRLPPSERGREQKIINAASTTLKIFPAVSGRFLVTAVNASLNLPADKTALVFHKGDDRYGIVIGGF